MKRQLDVDYLVFAGGGCRTVWQLGFLKSLHKYYELNIKTIAAVSAGSYMATIYAADAIDDGIDYFQNVTRNNDKNAYWAHLFTKHAVFPHAALYRQGILDLFDAKRFAKLQNAPEILIQSALPPRWAAPAAPGLLLGLIAYNVDKLIIGDVHRRLGKKIGFKTLVKSSKDCNSAHDLADAILKSSCSPPFTPILRDNGRAVLDGGLVDNVPLDLIKPIQQKHEKTLVLLSRKHQKPLPLGSNVTYIGPSTHPRIKRWDYSNPELLIETYELGLLDGENFAQKSLFQEAS